MTAMPAVQTIPSPYCFCTNHDSTGWRMGAIASVRMPMVSDARIGDRQHRLLQRMADCVGDRIRTEEKKSRRANALRLSYRTVMRSPACIRGTAPPRSPRR